MSGTYITELLDRSRSMLSLCYWWQRPDENTTWTPDQAIEHVYIDALPAKEFNQTHSRADLERLRPLSIVSIPEDEYKQKSTATNCVEFGGSVFFHFQYNVPDGMTNKDGELGRWAYTKMGQIQQTGDFDQPGLFELSFDPQPDRISPIAGINSGFYDRANENQVQEFGDYVWFNFSLDWGTI